MRSAPNDNANILVLYSEKVKSLAAKQRFLEKKRQGRPSKRPPLPYCGCFFAKYFYSAAMRQPSACSRIRIKRR